MRCTIYGEKTGNWDSLLPTIEMTINALPNSSTGYSPFYLNYGYHPVLPVELLKGDEEVQVEAVDNFVRRVQNEWKRAKENLLKSVQTQQMYYNQKHRAVEYQVGDLILLSTKNLKFKNVPAKLQKRFVGPFEITEKIGSQAYRVKLPDTWTMHDVFHVSLLKKWKTSVYRSDETKREDELDLEEEKQLKVEKLLRWKKMGRGQPPAYLVLWEGHPPEDATWEPADRFNPEDFNQWMVRDTPPEEQSNERGRSF